MHLIIDGHSNNPQKMRDLDLVYQFLYHYPSQIGMVRVAPPQVTKHGGPQDKTAGISGFVLLAESHISIHTLPAQSYIHIDVFSCKEFNAEQAILDFQERFGVTEIKSYVFDRASGMGREGNGLDHH